MAVQSNSGNEYKSSTKGNGGKKIGRMLFGNHYMLKKALRMIFTIIFVLLFAAALFGVINQRTTGESIADWASRTGNDIGNSIMSIFNGEDDAPLSVGTEGVYINGYEPEEQQELKDVYGNGDGSDQQEENNKDSDSENNDS